MRECINILGVNFDNVTMKEAVELGLSFFETETKHSIYTPNPEIVMEAYDNKILQKQLNQGSLVIPDGIGIVIGSKIIKKPLKMRVAGYDFVQQLFEHLKDTDKTVYFFGSKVGVAELAKKKMEVKYKGLKIVGVTDGYEKDNDKIIKAINKANPDMILVGLGAPRQEQWISQNMEMLSASVFIGVGGSFDGMSGQVPRAPKFFIKMNLEWFYRLITQPTRFRRMLRLPLFIMKMFKEGKKYN